MKLAFKVLVGLSCLVLAGCAWMRDAVIDQAAGFPASHVISDIKSTSEEYDREKQEERVEELNKEYTEFSRVRESAGNQEQESKQSVVIKQDSTVTIEPRTEQ